MPQVDTQDPEVKRRIVDKIRANKSKYDKLPAEKQNYLYGYFFDQLEKPRLDKSGLKPEEMQLARTNWTQAVRGGKIEALPGDFGVDPKTTNQKVKEGVETGAEYISSAAKGAGAGILGFERKLLSPMKKSLPLIDKGLARGEAQLYEDASKKHPTTAAIGAGVAKAVPSFAAWEAGSALAPELGLGRVGQKATQAVSGSTASSVIEGERNPTKIAEQATVNGVLDLLIGKFKSVKKPVAQLIMQKAAESKQPVVKEAAAVLHNEFDLIMKENYPGKKIGDLQQKDWDAINKIAGEKAKAAQAAKDEAKKALAVAKSAQEPPKAAKLTDDEKIAQKQQVALKASEDRKAKATASKEFNKRLTEYRKRTNTVASGDHWEQLKAGKTANDILGAEDDKAIENITQRAQQHQAKTLTEGAPKMMEGLETINQLAPETKVKKEAMFKTDMSGLLDPESPEAFAAHKKQLMDSVTTQAKGMIKEASPDQQAKILAEVKKEHARIKSAPVPSKFNAKTVDAHRKSSEVKAGMTEINAQAEEKLTTSITNPNAQPMNDLIDQIDKSKALAKELEEKFPAAIPHIQKAWKKADPEGGDIAIWIDLAERALEGKRKLVVQ